MSNDLAILEEKGRALAEFKPETFQRDMAQIRSISDVMLRKLREEQKALIKEIEETDLDPSTVEGMIAELRERHENMLAKLAFLRTNHTNKAVAYWDSQIGPVGNPSFNPHPEARIGKTEAELEEELGFSHQTFSKWRRTDHYDRLILGWLKSAGIIEPKQTDEGDDEEEDDDRDVAVDAMFLAYTRLNHDQRDELKARIIAFDKKHPAPEAEFVAK